MKETVLEILDFYLSLMVLTGAGMTGVCDNVGGGGNVSSVGPPLLLLLSSVATLN